MLGDNQRRSTHYRLTMTIRTNKQAIYAKTQTTKGTPEVPTKTDLIPISSDISKTFIEDNSVERPELKGTFGANDSVIISETQAVSIPSFIQGGGASSAIVARPPVDPLLLCCFHRRRYFKAADADGATDGTDALGVSYAPVDNDPDNGGATILYQIDGIRQQMGDALGTMSLNIEVGSFATMTFECQGPYSDPTKETDLGQPTTKFQEVLAVSGASTLTVPGLPDEFTECVRSFSLAQNAVITAIDCAAKTKRKITYTQTGRAATGEIVMDIDKEKLTKLVAKWGGKGTLSAPYKYGDNAKPGLIKLGTKAGNTFIVGINNFKIGAPTAGDTDGIATWTLPFTCLPIGGVPDYELYYV